jgi:hypothetical protein
MEQNKGFRTVTVPARTYNTCKGCYHFGVMKTFFGHKDVKGSFHCLFPDKGGDMRFREQNINNIRAVPPDEGMYLGSGSINDEIFTPASCPYLPENKR